MGFGDGCCRVGSSPCSLPLDSFYLLIEWNAAWGVSDSFNVGAFGRVGADDWPAP